MLLSVETPKEIEIVIRLKGVPLFSFKPSCQMGMMIIKRFSMHYKNKKTGTEKNGSMKIFIFLIQRKISQIQTSLVISL